MGPGAVEESGPSRRPRLVRIGLLVVLGVLIPLAIIEIPSRINMREIGRQKRTMSDMRTIATALESYSIDHYSAYPTTTASGGAALDELVPLLQPTYVKVVPRSDAWTRPFEIVSTPTEYTIASFGSDGRSDTLDGPLVGRHGEYTSLRNDIIFSTGSFVQAPGSGY